MKHARGIPVSDVVPIVHRDVLLRTPLTTLQHDERCDTCAWPAICADDQTCWHDEAREPWQRATLTLQDTPKRGRNSR